MCIFEDTAVSSLRIYIYIFFNIYILMNYFKSFKSNPYVFLKKFV